MKKDKDELKKELRDIAPFLDALQGVDTGEKIPDGYFDQLEASVLARLDAEGLPNNDAPQAPTLRLAWKWNIVLAAAAVFCLLLSAWWYFKPASTDPAVPADYLAQAAQLTAEDAEAYILNNLHEFETTTLVDYVAAVEPTTQESGTQPGPDKKAQEILNDISPEDIDMLLDELSEEELQELL